MSRHRSAPAHDRPQTPGPLPARRGLRAALVCLAASLALGCGEAETRGRLATAARLAARAEEASRTGDDETAETLWLRSLALRGKAVGRLHPSLLEDHARLAAFYFNLGRWPESEEHERRRLEILEARRPGDDELRAEIHAGLGWCGFKQARYLAAAKEAARARYALGSVQEPDPALEVLLLGLEGELLRIQDRFREAEESLRRAAGLARRAFGDADPWTLDQSNNLAGVLKDQGRLGEAEELIAGILEVQAADPDAFAASLPTAELNRAEILRLQGRLDEALPHYERALELGEEMLRDDPELAVFYNQLAVLHAEAGRVVEADRLYRDGLAWAREALEDPDHPLVAQGHHDLARLRRDAGDLAGAEELYRRAISMRERRLGAGHSEIAWSATELARTLYLAGGARDSEALALVERAIAVLERSLAYPQVLAEAHAVRADLLERSGDRPGAVAAIEEAIAVVEGLRPVSGGEAARAELLGRWAGYYDRMVSWQVAARRPAEAFRWSERGRARALLERLALAGVDLRRGIDAAVLHPLEAEERRLKLAIAEARAELDRASGSAAARGDQASRQRGLERRLAVLVRSVWEVEERIRRSSPLWSDLAGESATLSAAEAARRLLGDGKRLLLYQVGEAESVVLLLSPPPRPARAWRLTVSRDAADRLGVARGPLTQATLDSLVSGAVRRLGFGEATAGPHRLLHPLFRLLVPAGLWAELAGAETVIVVPDGALHELPFEMLVIDEGAGGEPRYWLDEGPVVTYAPSATVLAGLAGDRSHDQAVIVADPIFDPAAAEAARHTVLAAASPTASREEVPGRGPLYLPTAPARGAGELWPLPGTAAEARGIETALSARGRRVEVLQGLDAEESRVRASLDRRPALVHFATHGVVEEGSNELLAALALTPPPAGGEPTSDADGLLQLFEIYALDLPAELVVLSACQTHRGRRVDGEGVFALSRGFLAAGGRRVVASQWPVDDESTAALMRELYRRLGPAAGLGGGGVAEALRDAKRAVRAEPRWKSPYHWAGFVLIGDD